MLVDSPQAKVIRGWVRKPNRDLGFAALALRGMPEGFADAACFHAQQCVEKHLKALLLADGQEVPKSHDIGKLWRMIPEAMRPELSTEEQDSLSEYAVALRYEGTTDPTVAQANDAVRVAERVSEAVRRELARLLGQNPADPR